MDIKVLIAMHKDYWRSKDDVYKSLYVGAKGSVAKWPQLRDDSGDNISHKNSNYCELTGFYWAWKNLECEFIGFCHYRRYFMKHILGIGTRIFRRKDYEAAMENCDIMMPVLSECAPTVIDHYAQCHNLSDIIKTGDVIEELYPEYKKTFDEVMSGRNIHGYNMFCTRKSIFDDYCKWLFDILFALEKRIDISGYDDYQKRVFGFIAERLFTVYIKHNNLKVLPETVCFMGKRGGLRRIQVWLQRKI